MVRKKPLMCFDLDGTLIDSTEAHVKSYKTVFKKNNLKFPGKKKLLKHFGWGIEVMLKQLFPNISSRKMKKVIDDHFNDLKENNKLLKPFPHVKEALKKLKPHFRLGIISNNYHRGILNTLKCTGISPKMFDVIIGEDDAKAKPSPNEILLAERLTKADAKYMVGDTIFDVKAGKKAKCITIAVLTGLHDIDTLMKSKPDIVASSVAILPDILLNK